MPVLGTVLGLGTGSRGAVCMEEAEEGTGLSENALDRTPEPP